jgi:hypothetical protein
LVQICGSLGEVGDGGSLETVGEACEEDFLLKFGWILMKTNSHHKRRKTMEAQVEE